MKDLANSLPKVILDNLSQRFSFEQVTESYDKAITGTEQDLKQLESNWESRRMAGEIFSDEMEKEFQNQLDGYYLVIRRFYEDLRDIKAHYVKQTENRVKYPSTPIPTYHLPAQGFVYVNHLNRMMKLYETGGWEEVLEYVTKITSEAKPVNEQHTEVQLQREKSNLNKAEKELLNAIK